MRSRSGCRLVREGGRCSTPFALTFLKIRPLQSAFSPDPRDPARGVAGDLGGARRPPRLRRLGGRESIPDPSIWIGGRAGRWPGDAADEPGIAGSRPDGGRRGDPAGACSARGTSPGPWSGGRSSPKPRSPRSCRSRSRSDPCSISSSRSWPRARPSRCSGRPIGGASRSPRARGRPRASRPNRARRQRTSPRPWLTARAPGRRSPSAAPTGSRTRPSSRIAGGRPRAPTGNGGSTRANRPSRRPTASGSSGRSPGAGSAPCTSPSTRPWDARWP